MTPGRDAFDRLPLPDMNPRGLLRHFGPGLILMMTGVGTSHLVTAPVAGGRFEYALLWCIPVAYIFKYYGFEMAFRFTNATGRSMLDAYTTAPGKWPVWYVLITTVVQCALGQAGRLAAAAAVLYYVVSQYLGLGLPAWVYGLGLGVVAVGIILYGRYAAVELATKVLAGMLFLSTVGVYLFEPAPLSAMGHFFTVETPVGSWLTVAAFLGLLPTGIDVSLQASEWGKAKRVGMGRIREQMEADGLARRFDPFAPRLEDLTVDVSKLPAHAQEYCRRWFRIGLWDFSLGHVVSFILATIFLLLAAVWLYPSEVAGNAVIGEIARIFTDSIGPGMMLVFLLGAFAATFSTAFNYFDGWPRVVGGVLPQPVPEHGGAAGHRRRRADRHPPRDGGLRVQHLPHHDAVLARGVRPHHGGAAASGVPGAGLVGARAVHRAGHVLPEPVLLPHGDPEDRHGVLPVARRPRLRVVQPARVHRPDRDRHRGARVRRHVVRSMTRSAA